MAHRAKQNSKTVLRRLGTLLCALICVSMLNGCTYLWRDPPETAGRMPPPKAAAERPDAEQPAMDGAMGMKTEPLFAEKLFSQNKRLDRLENAVQTLNDDFNATHDGTNSELDVLRDEVSTLKDEVATLREAQEAIKTRQEQQPESLQPRNMLPDDGAMSQGDAMGGPQSLSGAADGATGTQAAIKPETRRPSPPPAAGDKFTVRDIRFGEHSNKTRIVLDINGKPDYAISLDNVEKILLIELPGGAWTAAAEGSPKSQLIASYSAQGMGQGNAGNMLVISLKHVTEIVARDLLPPSSGSSGYRLVIDLYSRPVHS